MTDAQETLVTKSGERDVTVTRIVDAPRSLVFDCWTRPELLGRWLAGPAGWNLETCENDLRFGGHYRCVWRGPDGSVTSLGGVYREVVRPERIVATLIFEPDRTGGEIVGTLDLTQTAGRTTTTTTMHFDTPEGRESTLRQGLEDSVRAAYARLDALLATMLPSDYG